MYESKKFCTKCKRDYDYQHSPSKWDDVALGIVLGTLLGMVISTSVKYYLGG